MESIQKVIIYGATGNTGLCCVKAALDKGYEVTAFVRDEKKLPQDLVGKVNVIVGDATIPQDVENSLPGHQAVIVALGTRNDLSPTTVLSDSLLNILTSMQQWGIIRLSVCISAFLFWERSKVPEKYHPLTEDHERMLESLKTSTAQWTAVLPPHITESEGKGEYTVALDKGPGRTISKYDLGHFLVACLEKQEYACRICGICDASK